MLRMLTRRLTLGATLFLGLFLLAAGCGDEDSNPTDPTTNTQQDLENGVAGLTQFGQEVISSDGAQVAQSPQIVDLLGQMGFPGLDIAIPLARYAPGLLAKASVWRKASRMSPRPRVALDEHFGTYDRDVNDVSEPFPGWVLNDAGNPDDGFVFRFDLQDDIYTTDDMGNMVPLQGEIRFLDLVVDEGMPMNPEDDILTNVVFEIAASPVLGPLPKLVRINLRIELDETREPRSIAVGSTEANNTLHPDAAFLGNLLIALSVDVMPSEVPSKAGYNLNAVAQLFDSVENYALRFTLDLAGIDFDSDLPPQSGTISLGFGNTTTPSMPPWVFTVTASDFVEDPQNPGEYHSSISGGITFNQSVVASFSGDTTEVPIDIDGDEEPDGSCPNVNVTFTDDPENAYNMCVVLPAILNLLTPAP